MKNNKLSATDEDILSTFDKKFNHLKDKDIILYGIGEKTKLLIENLPQYKFCALLDKTSAGYKLYGVDVLTVDEAITKSKIIVIVANYASAHIIYERIAYLQKENVLNIYHMNGEKFNYPVELNQEKIICENVENIKATIETNDVISFDFFDTLASRNAMFPSDIFALVEQRIKKEHGLQLEFVALRMEAEKEAQLYYSKSMTIHHIYEVLGKNSFLSDSLLEEIKTYEIEIEFLMLSPREEVISLLMIISFKHLIIKKFFI